MVKVLGMILRNTRKLKGLTQMEMSKKLNVAENTISKYETEYSSPNFDTIKNFLDVCNFEIRFIDKDNKKVNKVEELSKEMDF